MCFGLKFRKTFQTFIDICKYVDGGCKQYQVVSDNLAKLCDNYAKDNVVRALQMAKFNTDYFPLDVVSMKIILSYL